MTRQPVSYPSRIAAKGEVVTRMPLHRLPAVNTGERVVSAAFWQCRAATFTATSRRDGAEYYGNID